MFSKDNMQKLYTVGGGELAYEYCMNCARSGFPMGLYELAEYEFSLGNMDRAIICAKEAIKYGEVRGYIGIAKILGRTESGYTNIQAALTLLSGDSVRELPDAVALKTQLEAALEAIKGETPKAGTVIDGNGGKSACESQETDTLCKTTGESREISSLVTENQGKIIYESQEADPLGKTACESREISSLVTENEGKIIYESQETDDSANNKAVPTVNGDSLYKTLCFLGEEPIQIEAAFQAISIIESGDSSALIPCFDRMNGNKLVNTILNILHTKEDLAVGLVCAAIAQAMCASLKPCADRFKAANVFARYATQPEYYKTLCEMYTPQVVAKLVYSRTYNFPGDEINRIKDFGLFHNKQDFMDWVKRCSEAKLRDGTVLNPEAVVYNTVFTLEPKFFYGTGSERGALIVELLKCYKHYAEEMPFAKHRLAHVYRYKCIENSNPRFIFGLFREAARKGCYQSDYQIGLCYEYGYGVKQSYKKAMAIYATSIKMHKLNAWRCKIRLAYLLVMQNEEGAFEGAERLLESVGADIEYRGNAVRGIISCIQGDFETAAKLYYKQKRTLHIDLNDVFKNMYIEHLIYEHSIGERSKDTYKQLADCYMSGMGVALDTEKGFEYLCRAAESKNPVAEIKVGRWFGLLFASYTDKEYTQKEVFEYYKTQAMYNHRAKYNLGMCYMQGRGTAVDYERAMAIFSDLTLSQDETVRSYAVCAKIECLQKQSVDFETVLDLYEAEIQYQKARLKAKGVKFDSRLFTGYAILMSEHCKDSELIMYYNHLVEIASPDKFGERFNATDLRATLYVAILGEKCSMNLHKELVEAACEAGYDGAQLWFCNNERRDQQKTTDYCTRAARQGNVQAILLLIDKLKNKNWSNASDDLADLWMRRLVAILEQKRDIEGYKSLLKLCKKQKTSYSYIIDSLNKLSDLTNEEKLLLADCYNAADDEMATALYRELAACDEDNVAAQAAIAYCDSVMTSSKPGEINQAKVLLSNVWQRMKGGSGDLFNRLTVKYGVNFADLSKREVRNKLLTYYDIVESSGEAQVALGKGAENTETAILCYKNGVKLGNKEAHILLEEGDMELAVELYEECIRFRSQKTSGFTYYRYYLHLKAIGDLENMDKYLWIACEHGCEEAIMLAKEQGWVM